MFLLNFGSRFNNWETSTQLVRDRKVLVTGGAGFIGSHLVESLKQDNEVVVVDDLSKGSRSNLDDKFDIHQIDITDKDSLRSVFEQNSFDILFHLASRTNVSESVENPEKDLNVTVKGTSNLLELSREMDLDKIVFTSSAAVYGDSDKTFTEDSGTNPRSPYSAAKLMAEKLGLSYCNIYDTHFVVVRIANVYGPGQKSQVVHDFVKKLDQDPQELEVLGDGNQVRNFCHVKDVVDGLLLCAEKGDSGEIYNLAGDENTTITELAEKISSLYSSETDIECTGSTWKGDVDKIKVDNSKIKEIGFKQDYSLVDGIREYKNWYEDNWHRR